MEEDLKVLENWLKYSDCDKCEDVGNCYGCSIEIEEVRALKNLINFIKSHKNNHKNNFEGYKPSIKITNSSFKNN